MTNMILCRLLVFRSLGQHAPRHASRFISQGNAGLVFPSSRGKFHSPEISPVFRGISGNHTAKRSSRTVDQQESSITTAQVKEIRTEFAKLKPAKVTLDGNRSLTVKEAVFALAPILERMKKRGFDIQEIAEKLHEKGIEVKPPTRAKYLNEFRRGKDRKTDTARPQKREERPQTDTVRPIETAEVVSHQKQTPGSLIIKPGTPMDEL
jgi:hypothetical protein